MWRHVVPCGLLYTAVSEEYAVCMVTVAQASRLELSRNLRRHRYTSVRSQV
jgi:hypothetical protein